MSKEDIIEKMNSILDELRCIHNRLDSIENYLVRIDSRDEQFRKQHR